MTRMPIGEVDMEKQKKFIKLFDERIAKALSSGGFSYIQEKVNGDQTVYCFEASPELTEVIRGFCEGRNYEEMITVEDSTLLF